MNGRQGRGVVAIGVLVLLLSACTARPVDYSGDSRADFVYTIGGDWYVAGNPNPIFNGVMFDTPVPGDYTGSGKWQPAVLRGRDWISPAFAAIHFDPEGLPPGPPVYPTWWPSRLGPSDSADPVPADYDGTGKTQPAYYSLVDGTWWVSGHPDPVHLGIPPTGDGNGGWDIPVPADYDGDGKADIAVFRPTDSTYHVLPSSGGPELVLDTGTTDRPMVPAPADYDGDGKADPAVATVDGTRWYRHGVIGPFATFGADTQTSPVPDPADYDGDGKADPALVHITGWTPPSGESSVTLEVAGQAPIASPTATTLVGATSPPAGILSFYVMLVFYDRCLHNDFWHTQYPAHCPGP